MKAQTLKGNAVRVAPDRTPNVQFWDWEQQQYQSGWLGRESKIRPLTFHIVGTNGVNYLCVDAGLITNP